MFFRSAEQKHRCFASLSMTMKAKLRYRCKFSTIIAIPCPPPMHAVPKP